MVSLLNSWDSAHFFNDAFLKNDYTSTTELEHDLDFVITREVYKNFEYVTVKTIRWATILMYFKPQQSINWVLKLQTEVARQRVDLKEFHKILDAII